MTESKSLAIIPTTIGELQSLAEILSKSALLPEAMRGKAADVLVTIMAGQEMGLAPMASLRSFHVIDGKPVMTADGMVAVVLGSGRAAYFERIEESDTRVIYETLRIGAKTPRRCTWTLAQAKNAALDKKDNWRLFPRAMLASRAKSELARDVYPDVLAGCYTADEIERPESVREPFPDVVDAEIVVEPKPPSEIDGIESATTIDELKKIAPALGKLTGDEKDQARRRYKAQLETLRAAMRVTLSKTPEMTAEP